jgi:hypothetical protein
VKLLLVTFSLRNRTKDYNPFLVALRGNVLQWWHFIEQTCVVATEHNVQSLTNELLPHIETTDSLLVVELTPHQMQGWLPAVAWEWLNNVSETITPKQPALPFSPPPMTRPPAPLSMPPAPLTLPPYKKG